MTRNLQNLPLAINLFGPMVFKKTGKLLEVWLPKLGKKHRHQLAIGTNVDSRELGALSEYHLIDPQFHSKESTHHNPPSNNPSVPYQDAAVFPPSQFFVHFKLPRPKCIIGFSPVSCRVYKGANPPGQFLYRPVGFRLFYDNVGSPVLKSSKNPKFHYKLKFDPAKDEKQHEAFIAYAPYNCSDFDHREAKYDFAELTKMVGLKVNLDFDPAYFTSRHGTMSRAMGTQKVGLLTGPARNCKAPILLLT